ncbi:hypothetical protein KPL78_19255 [Roseomonas sp. HJA6]|uniref:Rha family transcriptional regulator n=1 Tax=Roseomonas alba TaxID=2846776 RepID=A0ABS7AE45_9PROT|nr:phage regulatory CII family protein [Neoroseomonas alba]MBW6400007.1 hypothetical protein [Neoroseomonas alba]
MTSLLAPAERAAIKTAMRALVEDAGGVEAAASVTRLHFSTLAETYNPHKPDRMPQADVIADLERCVAQPRVTQVLARLAGYRLMPIGGGAGPVNRSLAEVFRNAADVGAAWATAMEDSRLSSAERQRIADELLELQAACMQAVGALLHGDAPQDGEG